MSDTSPRFGLPYLQAGQAQKEIAHNEALAAVDALLHAAAEGVANDPPPAPDDGACWIVGAAPTGAWSGHAHALARAAAGSWRLAAPREGLAVWLADNGLVARWTGGAWRIGAVPAARLEIGGFQVVGARQPAIAVPAGGSAPDGEARIALAAVIVALRTHGLIAS